MNKRKRGNNNDDISNKKPKSDFISASSLKNYINKDPIIDYLSYWNINELTQKPDKERYFEKTNNKGEFINYLLENGINFENEIYEKIKENHNVVQVFKNMSDLNIENFELTKKYILEGHNIIYQAVLYNYENNTYGVADLLVRSDYINMLVPNTIEKEEEKINNKYYYFAVDIKNSTIELNKDGIYVLNSKNLPFYKVQLLLYTKAISNIMGINITKAFIFGKRYHWGHNYENNNFSKLGTVDYKNIDFSYEEIFNKSISWIKDVRNNGDKWKLLPKPSIPELYPNMKNTTDINYKKIKTELANKIGEITQIWQVGVKHRMNAHKLGIYSWKNKNCNSKTLGFNINSQIGNIVDKMIKINRSTNKKIDPVKISYNDNNWQVCSNDTIEFYIDYETLYHNNENYIFMIGVGYNNNGWVFKNFNLKNLSNEEMNLMFIDFWNYINNVLQENNKKESRFIHWTKAEPSQYNKCVEKFMLPIKNFIDLFDVFKKTPIVIKGAFSFSLKDVANAMYKNKMINTCWNTIEKSEINCENGQDALLWGIKLYEQNNISDDNQILKAIRDYNEVDCKVMFEIIEYLRSKHI